MAQWRKVPSFSSSLLDAIYDSMDEPAGDEVEKQFDLRPRKDSASVEQEIESLRRAIRVEKWMEKQYDSSSHSGSSTSDFSSILSSSETEYSSASRTSIKTWKTPQFESTPKREWRFKSRALKIYDELKKVREPISPGGRIAKFFHSIFTPRKVKNNTQTQEQDLDGWSSVTVRKSSSVTVRKSRSVKDTNRTTTASRSCLTKNPSSRGNKSKRSVKFYPVGTTGGEDCKHHGRTSLNDDKIPGVGSQFMKKNMESFGFYGNFREEKLEFDGDDRSCTSSDLFELDIIGPGWKGTGDYRHEELPVFGTTSLKMNQAIANGLVM